MDQKLWIVEVNLGCDPILIIRDLIEETKWSYITKLRAGTKRYSKATKNRKYFLVEDDCVYFLRKIYTAELETAKKTVQKLDRLTSSEDKDVLDYANGIEKVVMRIDYDK